MNNGYEQSLRSLADDVIWIYPPGFDAPLDNGSGYATEYTDSAYASLTPVLITEDNTPEYQWTQYASNPQWAACTTSVDVAITAVWSDYSFKSTGYYPEGKIFTTGCPGMQATA